MASDPLDDVFTIEDRFYTQGYNAGLADGLPAGRAEGRSLGMSKGFDKFSEASRLASRAIVWANRLPPTASAKCDLPPLKTAGGGGGAAAAGGRLEKNVRSVYALLEPGTLSTRNEDEAVQDFDDRLRRAQGKVKIVERMVGGGGGASAATKAESPPVQSA